MANIFENTTKAPEVPEILNQYAIDLANSYGLNISVFGGNAIVAGVLTVVEEAALVLTDNVVNYIILDLTSGVLSIDTPTVTIPHVALYKLEVTGGQVVSCIDYRVLYYPAAVVLGATTLASIIHAATEKGSIANNDEFVQTDSATSYSLIKNKFSTLVSTLSALCSAGWNAATATIAATATTADSATKSGIPQNSRSTSYTTTLADANKHILHPTSDNNPRTFTIDSNSNVAYAIGTTLTFVNQINTLTIVITSDTLTLAGIGTTGSRMLNSSGMATAIKVEATKWVITGQGIS